MSLYRKYRPQGLDDMVWQHHILDVLRAQARAGRFSHNYILFGPRGTGKTTTARLIAKLVNATIPEAWTHLADDPASALIDSGHTVDFVEIDAASHTGVDNIRDEIISKALYSPSQLQKKVYVIDEVHMLSKWAFNALLKIMEEPPPYLVFVLATTEITKVPDTIVSRCQVFQFKQLGTADLVDRLTHIANLEHISYDPEALALIAKLSNGGARDAIKYLEQLSMIGKVSVEAVTTFLGVISEATLEELLALITTKQADACMTMIDRLAAAGVDMQQCIKDLLHYMDDHFLDHPTAYAAIAQVCIAILGGCRSYPHPVIVIKTHLRQWIQWDTVSAAVPPAPQKPMSTPAPVSSTKPAQTIEASMPIAPSIPANEPTSLPTPAPDSLAPAPVLFTDTYGAHETLLMQLIDRIDKTMIKSILKKSTIVGRVTDELVELIITSEQYCSMINGSETRALLETEVSDILKRPVRIVCTYKSKEDYLQQALQ